MLTFDSEPLVDSRKSRDIVVTKDRASRNLELLRGLDQDYPTSGINGFESLVNFAPSSDQPIHRWFRYREGYSIELVGRLIAHLPRGSAILDPFCGAGASLIAAQQLGYESYGIDINPISVLVSRAKTTRYTRSELDQVKKLRRAILRLKPGSKAAEPPKLRILPKVFHPDVLHGLLVSKALIDGVQSERVRDLILVGWLSILEAVSNVYKEGNGIKYRNRKRTPNGYYTIDDEEWQRNLFPEDKFRFPLQTLAVRLGEMLSDLEERGSNIPPAHVTQARAEDLGSIVPSNSISYVCFSPPYCNCFNYFKIFKVELWMGGFVDDYKDIQELNRQALRSHVETVLSREDDVEIPIVDKFVDLIDPDQIWDRRIPRAVQGYFVDMRRVLNELHTVMKPSADCAIVVGNSAYSGVVIPTDALLAKLGSDVGFEFRKIAVARHLTTSSQQKLKLKGSREYLRESLVFLHKSDPRLSDRELQVVEEIPQDVRQGSVLAIRNSRLTEGTHKFHRYPGKFIPHLPRWAIRKYLSGNRGARVLDPFCGSGTTNVESMHLGFDSYALDVDPIARLVTKVKTTPIQEQHLSEVADHVDALLARGKPTHRFAPKIPTLSHWFSDEAVCQLSMIRETVETFRDDRDIYDFLLVCFVSVIRRASNADNQTQKTYVSHTHPKDPEPAIPLFKKELRDYAARLSRLDSARSLLGSVEILKETDIRNLQAHWLESDLEPVDLIVTSPPYVKTVDYVYNQMAEYFWVGDLYGLETQSAQNEYKKRYLGTEKVSKDAYQKRCAGPTASVDNLAGQVATKSIKNAYIVARYFSEMQKHLSSFARISKPGAHTVIVVGDSIVSGEVIPTHELLQEIAVDCGFSVANVFGYEIRNRHMRFPRKGRGGIVRYDWVLDLEVP